MIRTGIIGGGGYTAGELLRILYAHPEAEIAFVYSESQAGKSIAAVHTDLLFLHEIHFVNQLEEVDVLFLCQGHGKAITFLEKQAIPSSTKIIDLGNDFRINNQEWTYGLPELNRNSITKATRVANPGCFATALQLAILPLAKAKLLSNPLHISATTGSTGAGQKLMRTTHFTYRQNNLSTYKVFSHQHEGELKQSIHTLQNDQPEIYFLPHRGDFTRGIYATIYTHINAELAEVKSMYQSFYEIHPFTILSEDELSLKQVVNTNFCYLHLRSEKGMIIITSIIDNLLKGASGQAIQNMNIMHGLPENTGLKLKPTAF